MKINSVKETSIQRVVALAEWKANKKKQPVADPIILKAPAQEVRGLDKSPSPFSFESEIQKLKISITLMELVKN